MKPTIIKGWDISKEEYLKSHENGRLVKLSIDLSNVCNLSCPGCFTKRIGERSNKKGKKRLSNEMPYSHQISLLEEAAMLGAKTVDIVGAGEPTLDVYFYEILEKINELGMYAVVFTHGATRVFENPEKWINMNVSFVIKLWSRNPKLQDNYVRGSVKNYSLKRDRNIERMIEAGLSEGEEIILDNILYRTSRLGADILVMRSNYNEIPDIFRFCRLQNIMPLIKTYIPEGPTRFDKSNSLTIYDPNQLTLLQEEEISFIDFLKLREKLVQIDKNEFGVPELKTFYPQSTKCTQSIASLYVTITGEIKSCVGTHISYGRYEPRKDMLRKVIEKRVEKTSFGCIPRIEDAKERDLQIPENLLKIYSEGIRSEFNQKSF